MKDIKIALTADREAIEGATQPLRELLEGLQKASSLADELAQRLKELGLEIDFRRIQG